MRSRLPLLLAAAGGVLLLAPPAGAVVLPERTLRIAEDAVAPVVSTDGRTVVLTQRAGGATAVVAVDLVARTRRVVSEGAGGDAGQPAVSGDGRTVAFVAGGRVLVRTDRGPLVPADVGLRGTAPDGPSSAPDLSADGRRVAFVTSATNLVPGDRNGRPDVVVRDLRTGITRLASAAVGGGSAAGASGSPALSGDGRTVVFASAAADLVRRDRNGVADVFARDVDRSSTERVSLATDGRPQSRALAPGFAMQPDVSRDGRYVVWESDAPDLAPDDRNGRTDVFLRDRRAGTTRLVSAGSTRVQGDNDSFAPRLSANGRFLVFRTLASNLVPAGEDGPREDVVVRDLRTGLTAIASVPQGGGRRAPEPAGGPDPGPAGLSGDATLVAFASAAPGLVPGDPGGVTDVVLRRLDPAAVSVVRRPTRSRPVLRVASDEPGATRFFCTVDDGPAEACGPALDLGSRVARRVVLRAAGPGLLPDPEGLEVVPWRDRARARVRLAAVSRTRALREVRGTATDAGSGVVRVEVAVALVGSGRGARGCRHVVGRALRPGRCAALRFAPATGRGTWRARLPRALRGPVVVAARAVDRAGGRSTTAVRRVVIR